jgi:hypothetical protein
MIAEMVVAENPSVAFGPPLPSDDPDTPELNKFMSRSRSADGPLAVQTLAARFEAFHTKAAGVLDRAQLRGHHEGSAIFGGTLVTARVTRNGVTIREQAAGAAAGRPRRMPRENRARQAVGLGAGAGDQDTVACANCRGAARNCPGFGRGFLWAQI